MSSTTATAAAASANTSAADGTNYGSTVYRYYVLILLTLVYTLNFIDRQLLGVIAQPIIAAFNLSDTQYGFLNGWPFAIFYAAMGIPIAMLSDRFNRVAVIALCISIWSVMAALCGFATSFLFLIMARIGVAIGESGGTPASNSIIGDYFKPKKRAAALGIFAMGVTVGTALSNYFGGKILTGLSGARLQSLFESWGWQTVLSWTDWSKLEGWRVAFVAIGAPGVIVALIAILTIKEPPRGFSNPPGLAKSAPAGMLETFKELLGKPTFWTLSLGAALVAWVGYGLVAFQAPMTQRIHGVDPGTFAIRLGVPLALVSALGTFAGGMIVERISHRLQSAVAVVPGIGMLIAVPLYVIAYYGSTENLFGLTRSVWFGAVFFHYMYLGSQYTISQGVVREHSRASAVAIMLLLIAIIGNGIGPWIVGKLSDMYMNLDLANAGFGGVLTNELCRNAKEVAKLAVEQKAACTHAYGEGLRSSMVTNVMIFIPAAICFFLAARTLKKDMVAKLH